MKRKNNYIAPTKPKAKSNQKTNRKKRFNKTT